MLTGIPAEGMCERWSHIILTSNITPIPFHHHHHFTVLHLQGSPRCSLLYCITHRTLNIMSGIHDRWRPRLPRPHSTSSQKAGCTPAPTIIASPHSDFVQTHQASPHSVQQPYWILPMPSWTFEFCGRDPIRAVNFGSAPKKRARDVVILSGRVYMMLPRLPHGPRTLHVSLLLSLTSWWVYHRVHGVPMVWEIDWP